MCSSDLFPLPVSYFLICLFSLLFRFLLFLFFLFSIFDSPPHSLSALPHRGAFRVDYAALTVEGWQEDNFTPSRPAQIPMRSYDTEHNLIAGRQPLHRLGPAARPPHLHPPRAPLPPPEQVSPGIVSLYIYVYICIIYCSVSRTSSASRAIVSRCVLEHVPQAT